jgi:nucleoside-triphosphatase THEP1
MALLLTGAPGVGKTTIIQKLAGAYPDKTLRGFVTQEMRRAGRRVGFELRTFGGRKQVLAHVDIDSPHRVGRYGVDIELAPFWWTPRGDCGPLEVHRWEKESSTPRHSRRTLCV